MYLFGFDYLNNALRHVQNISITSRSNGSDGVCGGQLIRRLLCGMDLIVEKPSYAKGMMWRSRVFVSCSIQPGVMDFFAELTCAAYFLVISLQNIGSKCWACEAVLSHWGLQ